MTFTEILKYSIDLLAVLFLALGIKGLSKVRSAREANRLAAVAMTLAVFGVLVNSLGDIGISLTAWLWIVFGSVIGACLGAITAKRVPMTAMPETVALFNGCGGMSSLLVALAVALFSNTTAQLENGLVEKISIGISVFVGAITFTGSIIAMAKLQGWLSTPPWMQSKIRHIVNIALFVLALIAFFEISIGGDRGLFLLVISSSLLGIGVTLPIGGADMPVVISLLNSYSGVAAAAAGFVVRSQLLIVAGAMVGAAGLILTQVMCNGMNRSLISVLFGGAIGVDTSSGEGTAGEYTNITSCSVEECALTLEAAERVVIVPGYGLAVAQAQHTLREVTRSLEANGINVTYAIHPVAGRMPGHMNVLLAEADVPYEQLKEMDVINPEFPATDVVLVLGANDVVNPQAKNNPSSPLYGMPVLDVQDARTVFVVKRGMSAGYSGIKNDLFELTNTSMVFGDAKKVLGDLLVELKELGIGSKG
ncbi:NAD(P)(+) transhydrogenase (Re/Si-specific) subunit beta [Prochlorococcus marinus]|uniref:NAD(P) transhydrogenase subunit beta n=1 Tax=Prochlorococcus marinus (strain MIT 9211) TaxID=93059 RepID=A9BBD8_PROM4|nr:NAD(P)(+) transhydrogenase (Re/Si-specific) subunit beta [Prochlorococcus marinus]ABX09150.1 putative nicotinamide nucleotide transhydrogenase, subunit beta [Prochlorococcus marinus str. MIT 9211]